MVKSVGSSPPEGGESGGRRAQATSITFALCGLDARAIRVEVDARSGPAAFNIAGLADVSVRETRVRVRAAMQQIGVDLNGHTITVKLAPLDLPKSGGSFDLAIAVAILAVLRKVPAELLERTAFLGELSLSGALRPVRGALPALIGAGLHGTRRSIVPRANAEEAVFATGMSVSVVGHLGELVEHIEKGSALEQLGAAPWSVPTADAPGFDLSDVRGLDSAKRALEVAAAGAHNMIMIGAPGSGKTMLARRLTTILPLMTRLEALEVTSVHSVAGLLRQGDGIMRQRPFRAPHNTVSPAGLIGGGDGMRPGEVSLAHLGCLFLDELLEFRRSVLESLFWPIEEGVVTFIRKGTRADFPARPLLVAAINPCPCGFAGCSLRGTLCSCTVERVRAYRKRLSGPLFERIDLDVPIPSVDVTRLSSSAPGEPSAAVRRRVVAARAIQTARHESGEVSALTNGRLHAEELERVAKPDDAGARVLAAAVERLGFSAEARCKVLRVARTIADLDESVSVRALHVAEAVTSRVLDRTSPQNATADSEA